MSLGGKYRVTLKTLGRAAKLTRMASIRGFQKESNEYINHPLRRACSRPSESLDLVSKKRRSHELQSLEPRFTPQNTSNNKLKCRQGKYLVWLKGTVQASVNRASRRARESIKVL